MSENLLPLLSFILATVYTPGPNNISSAAMGVLHGYRKTLPYIMGIITGFFFVMMISAGVSASLLVTFPFLETILRYIGAAYILYLAYATFKSSYTFEEGETKPLGYKNGLLLQALNPKGIVFGLTVFSTFLAPLTEQFGSLVLAAFLLTLTSFTGVSLWTLSGSAIKTYLQNPRVGIAVNAFLSLLLVYSAIELSGLV